MTQGPADPNLHALGLLDGKQSVDDEIKVNEDESPQIVLAGLGKSIFTAIKLAEAIPILGPLLTSILPANPGKVSAFAGLETEGLAGKQIRLGSGGPQGGVLARIAGDLIKNSAIPGGSPHGEGGSSGGDGGGGGGDSGGSQGFESYAASSGMGEMFIAAGGGNRFESISVPESMLGTLSSPIIGDMGMGGRGAAMDRA